MTGVRHKLKSNIIMNLYRGINLKKSGWQVRLFLLLDALIILFCIPGIYHINQKADLPFSIVQKDDVLTAGAIKGHPGSIQPGDTILAINGRHFQDREGIEIYLDSRSIGEKVSIEVASKGISRVSEVGLTKYYSLPFVISNSISGLLFILLGILVFIKCPGLKAAKIFHWGSMGIAVMLLYTWGKYTAFPEEIGIAVRILYQLAYVLTPVAFFHFSIVFPRDREGRSKYIPAPLYSAAIVIAVINIYFFLEMIPSLTEQGIRNYNSVYTLNRVFAILNILGAISIFVISLIKTEDEVEIKKLKWLLTGFIIGPLSFVLLWTLPILLFSVPFIPEILLPVLMLSVPATFTVAIVQYHLMDIDLLIRRGVVYVVVIILLILIYTAVISIISNQVQLISNQVPAVVAAIIVALLFEPVRRKVKLIVEKMFFRVHYDFREALKKFIKNISEVHSVQQLAEMVVRNTQEFIPVSKIGFFILRNDFIRLIAHHNFNLLVNRSLKFDSDKLKTDLANPVADPSKVEAGVPFESADIPTFKRWGMDLVIPVKAVSGEIYGFLVLGGKTSGNRFSIEDIDLLNNVASNIASTLSRIYLQEELIRKNLETERLEELNKQKTMFVSTVSHDLKTPLASIKVFSEIMKNDQKTTDKQIKYLEIIEGESDRLTRLINNVLGFAWIEKGTKRYSFDTISLNDIVSKAVKILSYQFKMEGFKVEVNLSSEESLITADPDAVMQVLSNLIGNAIKFSVKQKHISISTFHFEKYFCVEVRDKGIGIRPEDLKNLFKPFFRSSIAGDKKIGGTGLGLSIIKHVMDAHKGKIEVESVPDEGTSFILKFPVEKYQNNVSESTDSVSNPLKEKED